MESSCFELYRDGKYSLFWAKKLMKRWYLLITEKTLFWTFRRWEIQSFLSQKVDGKIIFPWSFWAFHDIPGLGKYGLSCSVSLIWFVFCQLIYIKSTYIYSASSYMYSVWSYIHSVILYIFSLILYVLSMIFYIFSHLLNTPKTFLEIRPKQTARWTIVLSGQKMNSSFWGQQEISRPRKPMKGLIWNVSRKNMHRF